MGQPAAWITLGVGVVACLLPDLVLVLLAQEARRATSAAVAPVSADVEAGKGRKTGRGVVQLTAVGSSVAGGPTSQQAAHPPCTRSARLGSLPAAGMTAARRPHAATDTPTHTGFAFSAGLESYFADQDGRAAHREAAAAATGGGNGAGQAAPHLLRTAPTWPPPRPARRFSAVEAIALATRHLPPRLVSRARSRLSALASREARDAAHAHAAADARTVVASEPDLGSARSLGSLDVDGKDGGEEWL